MFSDNANDMPCGIRLIGPSHGHCLEGHRCSPVRRITGEDLSGSFPVLCCAAGKKAIGQLVASFTRVFESLLTPAFEDNAPTLGCADGKMRLRRKASNAFERNIGPLFAQSATMRDALSWFAIHCHRCGMGAAGLGMTESPVATWPAGRPSLSFCGTFISSFR